MTSSRALSLFFLIVLSPLLIGCADPSRPLEISGDAVAGGRTQIVNSVGMKFSWIPAGQFLMGSAEPQAINEAANPEHRVRISQPFFMSIHEVTQRQYLNVMGHSVQHFTARGTGRPWVTGMNTSNHPADSVSWIQARWFCDALSLMPEEVAEGRSYRLPTEAEWEYACRAGTRTPFHSGEALTLAQANFSAPPDDQNKALTPRRTTPVGLYPSNAFGLYDMHGNVWEWCQGGLREYDGKDQVDPRGRSHLQHVLRGGAWNYPAAYCRSDYRQAAARAYTFFGFRVICDIKDGQIERPTASTASAGGANDASLASDGLAEKVILSPTRVETDFQNATNLDSSALVSSALGTGVSDSVPFGLRPVPVPIKNPLTSEKIELGRQLFFDTRLSANDTVSCATCHQPDKAWSNSEPFGHGIQGLVETRNVPTLFNVAYLTRLFWDGRAQSLEQSSLLPIQHEAEMGLSLVKLVDKLNGVPGYRRQFESIFGAEASEESIAKALASFLRTLLSGDAPLDRYRVGDLQALSPAARRGHDLFFFKAHCGSCHRGPNLTDDFFHNTGIGMEGYQPSDEKTSGDLGRFEVTGKLYDQGMFRTPTLREIARTAPYMHDGRFTTLEQVVDFYEQGGEANSYLDPKMSVLVLTDQEKADLVTFLKEALSSSNLSKVEPPKLPD